MTQTNTTPTLEYCNWTFWEVITPYQKWGIGRDCKGGDELENVTDTITRDDKKLWSPYKQSLEPQVQTFYPEPRPAANCPNCGRQINAVDPYDDGETWRI